MAPKKVQKQTLLSFWKGSSSNAPPTKSRRAQPPQHPDEDAGKKIQLVLSSLHGVMAGAQL